MILHLTAIFDTRQIILNISYPVFLMRHNIFPDILNKGVYRILFTQDAYLYTPVFSYALHIPVFVRIPPAWNCFKLYDNCHYYFLRFF